MLMLSRTLKSRANARATKFLQVWSLQATKNVSTYLERDKKISC